MVNDVTTQIISINILNFLMITLLNIFYFSKPHIEKLEHNVFSIIVLISLLGSIIGLISGIVASFFPNVLLGTILLKIYTIITVDWLCSLSFYTFIISSKKELNKVRVLNCLKIIIISSILFILLPMKYSIDDTIISVSGLLINTTYILSFLLVLFNLVMVIINIKHIKEKKYIPIYSMIILTFIFVMIQITNTSFNYLNSLLSMIVSYLLFFTIENPDVRLVEYEKREKELAISASEAKTAFLSSMSHELRTPLNAIVGLSEDIMSYQDKVPAEVREDSIDIVNASNTLLELIGNILDISKIEGGKLEIIEADYLPKEEIESLLKIMRTKVEEKDLAFNIFIDPNIPECLYGDRLRIKQIINNFLSNAVKYTEKGSVNFGVRWIDNSLQIRVSDTGRGIKKEDMDKLFEKFERLHVEKTSSVQGTGLGLAITKNLVNLMGGRIVVDSVYGKGSTFDVYIPQKLGNKDNIVREALSVEEKHVSDYTGKKVLVVDDNKLNIKVLRKAIATFNFEIDECYDGKQALEKIGANNYDLILMDIMMPVMGGEEAMGVLKQNPQFNTPVIALTADATTGAKERYMAMGFSDYLAKPFSRDIIANKLDNVLGNTK